MEEVGVELLLSFVHQQGQAWNPHCLASAQCTT